MRVTETSRESRKRSEIKVVEIPSSGLERQREATRSSGARTSRVRRRKNSLRRRRELETLPGRLDSLIQRTASGSTS